MEYSQYTNGIVHCNKMVHGQVISRIANGRVKATILGFPRMGYSWNNMKVFKV